ncbi:MAG: HAD hydrolase family protein [Odoribacteraceae bacterium]|jgi:3-deoxy-D-manno-octulosonate 8-phosphate phosphatase (KDO 8-P phosphatase)|nr:HAD hydrolase family protein [Odoribacteraceae bacterium]
MFKDDLKRISVFIFDMDGVFSRQEMNVTPRGELTRTACARDGYAVMYCIRKGYTVCVISGGSAPGARERFERLGVEDIYMDVENKLVALDDFIRRRGVNLENVMYMGDDIPDYNAMKRVGIPVCPADACEEIKEISRYISDMPGGSGCVRDVIAQVLKARGDWMDVNCHVKAK